MLNRPLWYWFLYSIPILLGIATLQVISIYVDTTNYLTIFRAKLLVSSSVAMYSSNDGDAMKSNIVAIENEKWKGIFDPRKPVKYYKFFNSPTLVGAINKYINPTSIVIYHSEEFRYLTPEELRYKLEFMVDSYPTKILIYLDMIGIDFNKLKYSHSHVLESVLPENTVVHNLEDFEYLLEIN